MPSNIEIKAKVRDLEPIRDRVAAIADGPVEILDQEDTFFACPGGRLKLRVFDDRRGELIHYHRGDTAAPKPSHYLIAPTSDPEALAAILGSVLGVSGIVRKRRWLYRVGQTRVHLDRVEDLGAFVELEVVLRPDQDEGEGIRIAFDLMSRLGIREDQLIDKAYIDLLADMPRPSPGKPEGTTTR
jgi:predicted adenylyl cyclase CyaB